MAQEYNFTADWFSYHIPVWRNLLGQLQPKRVLEIGSYEGRSAAFLIEDCEPVVELVCVDPWLHQPQYEAIDINAAELNFDANITVARQRRPTPITIRKVKKTSSRALADMLSSDEPQFDLIYIDGSHEAPDVLTDAVGAFSLLRVGGIMIFDDYAWRGDNSGGNDILNLPKVAIDAFTNIFHRKLSFLTIHQTHLYQVYLRKVAE